MFDFTTQNCLNQSNNIACTIIAKVNYSIILICIVEK